jgi:hypothetical protein
LPAQELHTFKRLFQIKFNLPYLTSNNYFFFKRIL